MPITWIVPPGLARRRNVQTFVALDTRHASILEESVSAQTVDVYLSNQTSQVLALRHQHMESGAWVVAPPLSINPGGRGHWRSVKIANPERKDGRTDFYVDYATIDEQTRVRVYGDAPNLGQNLFRLSVSGVTPMAADPSGPVHNQGDAVAFMASVSSAQSSDTIIAGDAGQGDVYWMDGRPTWLGRR